MGKISKAIPSFTWLAFVPSEEAWELKALLIAVNTSVGSLFFNAQETEEREKDVLNHRFFHLYFFLYSTVFLKAEEWSKPGLLLLVKGGISSLTLKRFWHFVIVVSLSNSGDYSDSESKNYYQKATNRFSQKKKSDILLLLLGLQPHIFLINFEVK